jgi:hypothetical protein
MPSTYDHRLEGIGHPVRSAILKLQIGRLVVGWVTTSEYLLLYVFAFVFFAFLPVYPTCHHHYHLRQLFIPYHTLYCFNFLFYFILDPLFAFLSTGA